MSNAEINQICHQLAEEGKEPSVALIKARLSQKAPLPTIISGLQQWKNNPNHVVKETPTQQVSREKGLEQRVADLEKTVETLKAQIQHLSDKLDNE